MRRPLPLLSLVLLLACSQATEPAPTAPVEAPTAAQPAPEAASAPAPEAEPEAERPDPKGPFNLPHVERDYGSSEGPKPWLLAMHGLGSTAERFSGVLDHHDAPLTLVSVQATTPWGQGWSWFKLRDATPAERTETYLAALDALATFIDQWRAAHPDHDKPVVMGFSQGGMLSFGLAVRHPDKIAMAIPVAGALPTPDLLQDKTFEGELPPVRALHGLDDKRVPVQGAQATVDAMKSVGFDATIQTWPGVGHAMNAEMRQVVSALVTPPDPDAEVQ